MARSAVQFVLLILLIIFSVSTITLSTLHQYYLQASLNKNGKKHNLLSECNQYTFNHTHNKHITCKQSILTHSGVSYLSEILPNTDEIDGFASVRILDSFTFTNSKKKSKDGTSNCQYAKKSDGRHFPPLDLLQLRVIAEGVLNTIGSKSDEKDHDNDDGVSKIKQHNNPMPSSMDNNMNKVTNNGGFLISKEETEYLASTKDLGEDLHSLFKQAFNNRHIAFIGDSTTRQMYGLLASWLITLEGKTDVDRKARETLISRSRKKNLDVMIYNENNHSDIAQSTTRIQVNNSNNSIIKYKGRTVSDIEEINSFKNESANHHYQPTLTSPEANYILGIGCNNISNKQYKKVNSPYYGGRCAYRHKKCPKFQGCSNHLKIPTMNMSLSSTHTDGGCLLYQYPDFALENLIEFETGKKSKKSFINGQSSSSGLSLDIDDTIIPSDMEKKEGKEEIESNKLLNKGNEKVDIVVITGGMHYLHMYPVRQYDAKDPSKSLILGNYEKELNDSIYKLRQYLGKGKLVIWKTVNDICDDLYIGDYKQAIANYTLAGVFD